MDTPYGRRGIVGAGGVLVPPDGYIEGIRALCDKFLVRVGDWLGTQEIGGFWWFIATTTVGFRVDTYSSEDEEVRLSDNLSVVFQRRHHWS